MLFMCQWISDRWSKKSDNNSLLIHRTRRSQNDRPSLLYNVTHSTLVILIKVGLHHRACKCHVRVIEPNTADVIQALHVRYM
ncbi:hypothetical protein WN48_06613 [Eufriesea mexicana]|uniref:Uncharacterized protein n=1 Tax=Eufriesea mexicana TaxID=516756 RepID=A0A310SCF7_9HYME|nr:hypothetical protein WN48_06613 [Eufriesea mexicana]